MEGIPEPIQKKIYHYRDVSQFRDNLQEFDKIDEEINKLHDKKEMVKDNTLRLIENMVEKYVKDRGELKSLSPESLKEDVEKYLKIMGMDAKVYCTGDLQMSWEHEDEEYVLCIEIIGSCCEWKINILSDMVRGLLRNRKIAHGSSRRYPVLGKLYYRIPKDYFH